MDRDEPSPTSEVATTGSGNVNAAEHDAVRARPARRRRRTAAASRARRPGSRRRSSGPTASPVDGEDVRACQHPFELVTERPPRRARWRCEISPPCTSIVAPVASRNVPTSSHGADCAAPMIGERDGKHHRARPRHRLAALAVGPRDGHDPEQPTAPRRRRTSRPRCRSRCRDRERNRSTDAGARNPVVSSTRRTIRRKATVVRIARFKAVSQCQGIVVHDSG